MRFGALSAPLAASSNESFGAHFPKVAEQVLPSVVSVLPTKIDTVIFSRNPFYNFYSDNSLGDFFNYDGGGAGGVNEPQLERRQRRVQGLGSGVIVSADGYILTNYHVVQGAQEIEVRLHDKRVYGARVVGADSLADIAVLQIEKGIRLPVIRIGNSDSLKPGAWTMAIGNPYSLCWTVTAGIVSALGRSVSGAQRFENYIQTDAAINPGNSGGALVNLAGELVGINTMIYTRSGVSVGIGFAIPINMALGIAADLIAQGRVIRGWLGVGIQDLDQTMVRALGLKRGQRGVLISQVYAQQPAARAGLVRGDIIDTFDGNPVENANALRNMIAATHPGVRIRLGTIRHKHHRRVGVIACEWVEGSVPKQVEPLLQGERWQQARETLDVFGLQVTPLSGQLRRHLALGAGVEGVVVLSVQSGWPLGEMLRSGDVIASIKIEGRDMVEVHSVGLFSRESAEASQGAAVALLVQRGESCFYVAFDKR
jgi:serine protease Do